MKKHFIANASLIVALTFCNVAQAANSYELTSVGAFTAPINSGLCAYTVQVMDRKSRVVYETVSFASNPVWQGWYGGGFSEICRNECNQSAERLASQVKDQIINKDRTADVKIVIATCDSSKVPPLTPLPSPPPSPPTSPSNKSCKVSATGTFNQETRQCNVTYSGNKGSGMTATYNVASLSECVTECKGQLAGLRQGTYTSKYICEQPASVSADDSACNNIKTIGTPPPPAPPPPPACKIENSTIMGSFNSKTGLCTLLTDCPGKYVSQQESNIAYLGRLSETQCKNYCNNLGKRCVFGSTDGYTPPGTTPANPTTCDSATSDAAAIYTKADSMCKIVSSCQGTVLANIKVGNFSACNSYCKESWTGKCKSISQQ